MPIRPLSATDRIAIEDLLRNYVYCNDTHDVEGMLALFTEDAVLEIGTREHFKNKEGIRRFVTEHGSQPGRGGRQHLYQQVQIRRTATGCTVRSYWMVVQSVVATDTKLIRQIGYYDDKCVKIGGKWLIQHKFIDLWNDETPPPVRL